MLNQSRIKPHGCGFFVRSINVQVVLYDMGVGEVGKESEMGIRVHPTRRTML